MTNKEIIASWRGRIDKIGAQHHLIAKMAGISKSYFSQILSGEFDPKAMRHVDVIEKIIQKLEKKNGKD